MNETSTNNFNIIGNVKRGNQRKFIRNENNEKNNDDDCRSIADSNNKK